MCLYVHVSFLCDAILNSIENSNVMKNVFISSVNIYIHIFLNVIFVNGKINNI